MVFILPPEVIQYYLSKNQFKLNLLLILLCNAISLIGKFFNFFK